MSAPVPCSLCAEASWRGSTHPCCAYWMGRVGRRRCPACDESRRSALIRARRGRPSRR